jgi:hypothetical protein
MIHEAIYNLYPNVSSINGDSNAIDANGNSVVIDMTAVNQEAERIEAEAIAQAEAKAAATAETEAKLEALGLTKADLAALLGQ